jgi:hypothetical protein
LSEAYTTAIKTETQPLLDSMADAKEKVNDFKRDYDNVLA